jgi:ribose transport system substrate-binding protein
VATGAIAGASLTAVLGTGIASSASGACTPKNIDVGGGMTIKGGCSKLKIAYFSAGSNNVYLQAGIKAAKDTAKKIGADMTVFDGSFDAQKQFNQMQNAITSKKFNAFVTEVVDPRQACKLLTQTAPKAGIVVSNANQPLCGQGLAVGVKQWSPGTLTFVGGTQGKQAFHDWFFQVAKDNPGPQKVLVLTGPDGSTQTLSTDLAIKELKKAYPQFKIVAEVRTDYSVAQAFAKTQPVLQAHPDLTILMGNYSDLTRGIAQAVGAAGKKGKYKIYDSGGSSWAFQALKAGDIVSTRVYTPYTEIAKSVLALDSAWKGKKVPRNQDLFTAVVTKDNISKYKSEY